MFLNTAFNKNDRPGPSRVNYLITDTTTSSLTDFTNLVYNFQGITLGLGEPERRQLCGVGTTFPQNHLMQTISSPKPEGGNLNLMSGVS